MTDNLSTKTQIRQEGANVMVIENGKTVAIWPWHIADVVARAITMKARQAEEIAKAEQIIMDNAIIHRAGLPFGLSNHPKILQETKKEALYNRNLRRYMPNIKTNELVFTPVIRSLPPCSD